MVYYIPNLWTAEMSNIEDLDTSELRKRVRDLEKENKQLRKKNKQLEDREEEDEDREEEYSDEDMRMVIEMSKREEEQRLAK